MRSAPLSSSSSSSGCGPPGCPIAPFPVRSGGRVTRRVASPFLGGNPASCSVLGCGPALGSSGQLGGYSSIHSSRRRPRRYSFTRSFSHSSRRPRRYRRRRRSHRLYGGHFYKPPAPIPGPFVGQPWGASVQQWPGVDGVGSNRNYFVDNLYRHDPQLMMKLKGGRLHSSAHSSRRRRHLRHRRRHPHRQRGGGLSNLIPQDVTNLGSNVVYRATNAYNALRGVPPAVNPLPFKDQGRTVQSN